MSRKGLLILGIVCVILFALNVILRIIQQNIPGIIIYSILTIIWIIISCGNYKNYKEEQKEKGE